MNTLSRVHEVARRDIRASSLQAICCGQTFRTRGSRCLVTLAGRRGRSAVDAFARPAILDTRWGPVTIPLGVAYIRRMAPFDETQRMLSRRRVLFATAVAAGVACSGLAHAGETPSLYQLPWRWTDDEGHDVTFSTYRGVPVVLTMIYTSCRIRCPLTLAKLKKIDAAFAKARRPVQFVLATLDPRNDSWTKLNAFKRSQGLPGRTWHLLTGDMAQTTALWRLLGTHAAYDDGHIDHDVKIAVLGLDGRILRSFEGWDFDVQDALLP